MTVSGPRFHRRLYSQPETWRQQARCADKGMTHYFYPTNNDWRAAKSICADCSTRVECLAFGIDDEEGLWGGLSPRERLKLKRLQHRLGTEPNDPRNARDLASLTRAGIDPQQLQAMCGLDETASARLAEQAASLVQIQRTTPTLRERIKQGDPTVEHGNVTAYNAGCRCGSCRKARRADMQSRRARRRATNAA